MLGLGCDHSGYAVDFSSSFNSFPGGAEAQHASLTKVQKYASLTNTHYFVAIAVETLGPWNSEGLTLIRDIGKRITQVTMDMREIAFLIQRISMAVQIGNAASFLRSLPSVNLETAAD